MEWYLKVVRDNYANFEGRARRKEYWMFYLFHILIIFGLIMLAGLSAGLSEDFSMTPLIIAGIYVLVTLIPFLAVTVRRLHDTGKSGWWYFIGFIPYIGGIWLFILTVLEGNYGPNQYGPDPKGNFDEIEQIGTSLE